MSQPLPSAVIRAEPEGYDMGKVQLMGRQSAGSGFLRAAVAARGDRPIYGYTAAAASAAGFKAMVNRIDPAAAFEWIHADQLGRLSDVGVLYVADATVSRHVRLRMRAGATAFSVCGITHTTASLGVMDEIADLLREPAMPWDALICTSSAVVETVRRVHEAEAEYLRWRMGADVKPQRPELPLIPLGVHCDDFAFTPAQRTSARKALGIADDEIVGLFVGRLVFHAKAHPYPMLRAFQLAAERTGRKMTLIFSGWAPSTEIDNAFRDGAAAFAPDVRTLFIEGRDAALRDQVWAGSDMFLSPSDNIQETFGLTPIEAMAAGLPLVVSDYDGYKDTVEHGVQGIRVRTFAPSAGAGQALARAHETGAFSYDQYCWGAASMTAVDVGAFTDAVCALAQDADLRRRMGEAGRRRAREVYDWPVIYRRYQELWAELNTRRRAAAQDPSLAAWAQSAPPAAAARLDPFYAFGHYPTFAIDPNTRLVRGPDASPERLRQALGHPLFGSLAVPVDTILALFERASDQPFTIAAFASEAGLPVLPCIRAAAFLLKLGMVAAA